MLDSKVVIVWRPDEDRDDLLDGRWAVDLEIYSRDELPREYSGQDPFPPPFFSDVNAAIAYLEKRRPHDACQIALEAFCQRWPNFVLARSE